MQTIPVKSQIPSHLRINLSWGETVPLPEAADFIRLAEGEELIIPAGHATSIRSLDGWHKAYAFEDTLITGPIDISTPQSMKPKEFAPSTAEPGQAEVALIFSMVIGGAFMLAAISSFSFLVQLGALCGIIITIVLTFLTLMKASHRRAAASKNGDCATPTDRTFWREDLISAQSQAIRTV